MFERRLKILLFIMLVACGVLAIRAAQIQLLQHDLWRKQATEIMKRGEFIEVTRGTIFDRKGVQLVDDAPCVDACVDYRAITEVPDEQWVQDRATQSLKNSLGDQFRTMMHSAQGPDLLAQEIDRIRGNIAAMWDELAVAGNQTPEQIDDIRHEIVGRVEMRKRYIWWHNYEQTTARSERENSTSWYRHFLLDTAPDESAIDKFEIEVAEETAPHVILHNISPDVQGRLARQHDRFFCLSLVPSKYREYRFGRVACNLLGYVAPVRPDEVAFDSEFTDGQLEEYWSDEARRYWPADALERFGIPVFRELRRYWPTDLAGRAGVEALCEKTLRGTRGKIDRVAKTDTVVDQVDSVPGRNVTLSIDILLQQDIENEFVKTRVHRDKDTGAMETRYNQHGAAVVIKVDTGEVLALVSNPGFDPKDLQTQYAALAADELNRPLLDRATQLDVVPGSTVKPIVGSGAITDKIMTAEDKIQCRGELMILGRPQPYGRCWIYFPCVAQGIPISHRYNDPSIGPDDGLTISDGIKNSCNVVFETVALRMGMEKLSTWFDKFGLGRITGIGIEENPGLIYRPSEANRIEAQTQTWSAGIGEGHIQATPIQMANVAATIARDGIWMRPKLVARDDVGRFTTRPSGASGPDEVDLNLSPEALHAVQKGMREVCTADGTGRAILPEYIERGPNDPPLDQDPLRQIEIAGKTGSAQTGKLMTLVEHDASGKVTGTREVNFGDPGTEGWYLRPGSPTDPNPEKHLAHGWFIGYAPADHPQIAFCVFVEYGEAGGRVAGGIAHDLLVDCLKHGYLRAAK
jgi:cell division protein FtsI/penicillin-binding protein 2